MALFVDGPTQTVDSLRDHDSGLLDVAAGAGINVTTKIRLAHEEIEGELRYRLERPRSWMFETPGGLSLDHVVVGDTIRRWEAMLALAKVYEDAYFTQLVDRYQAKAQQFVVYARVAVENFLSAGVGLVSDPVRQASVPTLGTVTGPQKGGSFYASVAWVNARGQEGAASVATSGTVADGHLLTVSATGLPPNAAGFNVYAGSLLDGMTLQNTVPVLPGAMFTYVPGWSTNGRPPSVGQVAEFTRAIPRIILRG